MYVSRKIIGQADNLFSSFSFQVPSFNGLCVTMFWTYFHKDYWLNELINVKGVCITAPATTGLLKSIKIYDFLGHESGNLGPSRPEPISFTNSSKGKILFNNKYVFFCGSLVRAMSAHFTYIRGKKTLFFNRKVVIAWNLKPLKVPLP